MQLGIMSDTHDNVNMIKKAVDYFNQEQVDLVLHAGDLVSPFTIPSFKNLNSKMVAVYGNNDGEKLMLKEKINNINGEIHEEYHELNLEGQRIVMMHRPLFLDSLIKSDEYDMIIYGHTHAVDNRKIGKTQVLNPGECSGWLTSKSTVAICNLKTNVLKIEYL